jgi:hypothetical protein
MQVDQARNHVPVGSADFDGLLRLTRWDVGMQSGDTSAGDTDIQWAIEFLTGIENVIGFHKEIIEHGNSSILSILR